MPTKKYKVLIAEIDGVDLANNQEHALDTSDALQSAAGFATIPETRATTASTLTLTDTSNTAQVFTGTTVGQIVKLPDATTLPSGMRFELYNKSTQAIEVRDAGNTVLFTLSQTSIAYVILELNSTGAGAWIYWQVFVSSLASGILNYSVVSSTTFASSSTTDVVITSFTVTPVAGTYAIWFNIATENTSGTATNTASVYRAGTKIADSERAARMAAANSPFALGSMTVATFNGSQACDVRVRTASASQTVRARTLLLIRMGT